MESTRKKQKELTLSEKIQVLELLQRQKISQMELAKRFGVTQPVISRLIKNKEKVLMEWQNSTNPDRKRKREGRDSDVDAALLQWFQIARAQHILVSDEVLAVKAKSLADALQIRNFVPTVGWISRWKARHSAFLQQGHGESDSSGQPASGGTSDIVVPPEGMTEEEFHQYVEQAAIKVCVWDITDHEVTTDMKGIAKIEDIDGEEEKSMPVFKMARGSNGRPTPFSNQFNMPDGRSSASRRDLCVETPGSSYSQPGPSGYQSYTFSRWVTPELEREGKSSRFTALSQPSKSFEDLEKAEARLLRDVSLSPSCVRVPSASSPRPVSRDDLLFLQQQQGGIPRYGTSGHEREISSEEQELILENQRKFGMYLDEKRESLKRLHALEEELLRAKIEVEQIKAARLRALSV